MSTHTVLAAADAYRLWAGSWDSDPSPIVSLEARTLGPWLRDLAGKRVVDVSCGTGRWMDFAAARGARVIGVDLCFEMVEMADGRAGLASRLAVGDLRALPLRDGCADAVLCTLSLGHLAEAEIALSEMARVARRGAAVYLTDFHPEAFRLGWKRTFRAGRETYEIENHYHPLDSLVAAGARSGLALEEAVEPCFGEEERAIYLWAGRADLFETVRGVPAVLVSRWRA